MLRRSFLKTLGSVFAGGGITNLEVQCPGCEYGNPPLSNYCCQCGRELYFLRGDTLPCALPREDNPIPNLITRVNPGLQVGQEGPLALAMGDNLWMNATGLLTEYSLSLTQLPWIEDPRGWKKYLPPSRDAELNMHFYLRGIEQVAHVEEDE